MDENKHASTTTNHILVYITAPTEVAAELARALIDCRLAACANIFPSVRSLYRWKGELCDESEALLAIKTRAVHFEKLRAIVVRLHPYDLPEIIAVPLSCGHLPYLNWIDSETQLGE